MVLSAYEQDIAWDGCDWLRQLGPLLVVSPHLDDAVLGCADLLTRQPTLIDTGFANRLNNDHVLSFDGRTVAISDQTRGGSTIYALPATGGEPKQITQKTPSYMHGWSPDGKWLFYTGGRSNEFDIFKIAADGSGEEINLTNSKGLDDGPEMTPGTVIRDAVDPVLAAHKPIKVVSDGKVLGMVGRNEILAVIGKVDEGGA